MAENVFGPVDYSLTPAEQKIRSFKLNGFSSTTIDSLKKAGVDVKGILASGQTAKPASVNIKSIRGSTDSSDLRARLRVPDSYVTPSTSHGENSFPGIIFPYTPTISYDVRAEYGTQPLIHSNFSQHFYQRSTIGTINLTAKFTVQNENDAVAYLSTLHLLKSLTKMRAGDDPRAGSPPPVCRLSAYGPFMIENAPVAVNSFRVEYPDTVDYFTLGKLSPDSVFGTTAVPTLATFTIGFLPMYSRSETMDFTLTDWLKENANSAWKKKGYL